MLVTFSFSRQRDGAIFKAFFQAIPKAGLSAPTNIKKNITLLKLTYLLLHSAVYLICGKIASVLLGILCTLCQHLPLQAVEGQFPPGMALFPRPTILPITLQT